MYEKQVQNTGVTLADMAGTELIKGFNLRTFDLIEQKLQDNFKKGV